jgi:glucose/arabinose dehydrogenase
MYQEKSANTEAGMLGLALDPAFSTNHRLYLFHCPDTTRCKVMRLVEKDNVATVEKVLLQLKSGLNHVSGRIKIGPDGYLYIAYGDLRESWRSQSMSVLQGKILRITTDGAPAAGNPFSQQPLVYALGLRDPQGLAFDASGQLYATDHGEVSHDEVNLIYRGANYGWPTCQGRCGDVRFVDPAKLFYPETAAPSGCTFYLSGVIPQWRDSFFLGSLGLADNTFAHHVHRIKFKAPASGTIVAEEALYRGKYGRIRNVVEGKDGYLYFMTSNGGGADKILRVRPQ